LNIKDDLTRPLSARGLKKTDELVKTFDKIRIDKIFSSPYKRTIQTLEPVSKTKKLKILLINDFRERKISDDWINYFDEYCKKQWEDFSYKLENGESLSETQERNIRSLNEIINQNRDKTMIIGTHGTALSTIINYYDPSFGHREFLEIVNLMPYVIQFEFEGPRYVKRSAI